MLGFVRKSASAAPSRQTSATSPERNVPNGSRCRRSRRMALSVSAQSRGAMTARVLLADDHPLTRGALAGLLGANGFDVVAQASDGAEAVTRARELEPDVVVLDLTMPGMDGLTALPLL